MRVSELISSIGQEVEDAEEEAFLLFSQEIPSSNLGFIDSKSTTVDVTVHGQDFTVHQSPTVLTSKREGGTTGAVLWKTTPIFAEWICSKDNALWTTQFLNPESMVVEIGCGISALLPLALGPSIRHYIATDQSYVQKLFKENIETNSNASPAGHQPSSHKQYLSQNRRRSRKQGSSNQPPPPHGRRSKPHGSENITFAPLDWETDRPDALKTLITTTPQTHHHRSPCSSKVDDDTNDGEDDDPGFDILIASDCIYNDALIPDFVRTCADICRLRPAFSEDDAGGAGDALNPTLCIIAQQLRSHEVFEEWLRVALGEFRVWRVSDKVLGKELGGGSGYAMHVLLLRDG